MLAASAGMLFTACSENEGCTDPLALNYDPDADSDDGSCTYAVTPGHTKVTFEFSHLFNGAGITNADFNQFNYVTEQGDTLSLTKLRYLISDLRFYRQDGDSILIEGYQLVDVTAGTGFTLDPDLEIPHGNYVGLSFIWGLDETDNVDGAYPDLNAASWNWPAMLGGGYHFMQMEGMYLDGGVAMPYAYHNGTARVSAGVFEQNWFKVDLGMEALDKQYADITITFDIAEWYRNPHLWDLNVLNVNLMPNYDAQKMMNANGRTVFSLGNVDQAN